MNSGPGGVKIMLPSYGYIQTGNGHMKSAKGTIGDSFDGSLVRRHDASSGRGASGAPLIILDRNGKPGNTVYAMHVAQDADGRPLALEFSDTVYASITEWATD